MCCWILAIITELFTEALVFTGSYSYERQETEIISVQLRKLLDTSDKMTELVT